MVPWLRSLLTEVPNRTDSRCLRAEAVGTGTRCPRSCLVVLTDRDYRAVLAASPDAMLAVGSGGLIRDLDPQALTGPDS